MAVRRKLFGLDDNIVDSLEIAISLDSDILYKKFMDNDIQTFKMDYLNENFIGSHELFKKDINRIYIGNEFCHNLFPEIKLLKGMMQKAKEESLEITLCFTYMRECYIEKNKRYDRGSI